MAINYTQAFNAGEISRKMDGRSDLEVYKTGCRDLDNFLVLPQGGVERRAGTEFVQFAGTDGANPARMIEFDFSSDIRFVIELGTSYAKVHYTDDSGVDQVVNVTGTVPAYTSTELRQIQFNRKYDTLILTCPTKKTQVLKRETITPTFTIEEISFVYPPLQEVNITSTTIDVSTLNSGNQYSGVVTLTPSSEIFFAGHVDSNWAIDHIRAADKKEISDTRTTNGEDANSSSLDVSFSNWSFETDDTWNGSVVIQRQINGGGYVDYIVIGDTSTGVSRNFKYASDHPEGANTELRVKWVLATPAGSFKFSLESDNIYHKGIVKITAVDESANPNTATATIVSQIQGGQADPDATLHWSEGAFSTYRGFCPASEFFENRLWLAGSKDQPADIFASVFGEIFNFLPGTLSTDAIKRTIDSPEEPKWLESKRYLFLGTAGTAVSIRSADRDSLITQNNITTLIENAYGSAALQAEVANDVIVYVQRDGLKLRELVYSQGEDTFVGNDLNLISEDITDSGITEMFVQKQPNQFIWCIKENGEACVLTYERGQQVRGWARINTDGEYYSAASIHNGGEDTVWACVKRDSKYCIEKFHPRKDLDWYVDSGKRLEGGAAVNVTGVSLNSSKEVTITTGGHTLLDGEFVKFSANRTAYKVSDKDATTFKVKQAATNDYIIYNPQIGDTFDVVDTGGTTTLADANLTGTYKYNNGLWTNTTNPDAYFEAQFESDSTNQWLFYGNNVPAFADSANFTSSSLPYVAPWEASWNAFQVGITYTFSSANFTNILTTPFGVDFHQVFNQVTGLNNIENKTVQIIGDGSFVKEDTVSSNTVTTTDYYNTLLVGLPYTSTLRPMPIEPSLVNKLSQSRVKAVAKIIVRFFKTKGAKVGEAGRQLTTFPVADTQDSSGQVIDLKTGQQRFFVGSDYEREKLIEVRQDLPYPMTVLSIATHVNAEGA
jgi:hypothetical protein